MKITSEVKQIAAWLRSLDAPRYFYGISYEGLALCIEQGLDPKSAILNHLAPETVEKLNVLVEG